MNRACGLDPRGIVSGRPRQAVRGGLADLCRGSLAVRRLYRCFHDAWRWRRDEKEPPEGGTPGGDFRTCPKSPECDEADGGQADARRGGGGLGDGGHEGEIVEAGESGGRVHHHADDIVSPDGLVVEQGVVRCGADGVRSDHDGRGVLEGEGKGGVAVDAAAESHQAEDAQRSAKVRVRSALDPD